MVGVMDKKGLPILPFFGSSSIETALREFARHSGLICLIDSVDLSPNSTSGYHRNEAPAPTLALKAARLDARSYRMSCVDTAGPTDQLVLKIVKSPKGTGLFLSIRHSFSRSCTLFGDSSAAAA